MPAADSDDILSQMYDLMIRGINLALNFVEFRTQFSKTFSDEEFRID